MANPYFPSRFNSTFNTQFNNPIQNGLLNPTYGKQLPFSPVSNNYLNPRGQNPRSALIQQIYGMNGKSPLNQMGMEQNNLNAQNPYFDQLQKINPNIIGDNLPPIGNVGQQQPSPIDIETKLKGLSLEPQINKFTSNPLLEQLGIRENKEDYDRWKNNLLEHKELYKNYQNEGLGRRDLSKISTDKEPIFKQEPKPDIEQLGRIEAETLAQIQNEKNEMIKNNLARLKPLRKEAKEGHAAYNMALAHAGIQGGGAPVDWSTNDSAKFWDKYLQALNLQKKYLTAGHTLEEAQKNYPTNNLGSYPLANYQSYLSNQKNTNSANIGKSLRYK